MSQGGVIVLPAYEQRIRDNDKEYIQEVRHRCITDHLFLAPFLGYDKFVERIHKPVAEFYVQKKPGLPIEEQDKIHNRMHLDPRHTYKTTMGIVDTIQWIVAFPNVTIMNETATQPLAKALTNKQARFFWKKKYGDQPVFQLLFPEYLVDSEPSDEYIAPCRTEDQVEPTLSATSVKTTQSGYHPMILQPDDAADTENSGIDVGDKVRTGVWNRHSTNLNTLRHGGYINMRGTRYHPFDMYGMTLKTMNPKRWKTLIRPSLIVKSGLRLAEGDFPREEDVELVMPELLSYEDLKEKFANYEAFMCQQQNDPQGGALLLFPEELFLQSSLISENIPLTGDVEVCWRLPFNGKEFMRKYAEGVVCRITHKRVYVIDAFRGHYTPDELAKRIVRTCKLNGSGKVTIENTPGSEFIVREIQNAAAVQNWSLMIDRPDFDNDDNVRDSRIKQLEPYMRSGRLQIATDAGSYSELKNQFTHYGLIPENGLLDTISRMMNRVPASMIRRDFEQDELSAIAAQHGQEMWNQIFSQGGMQIAEEQVTQAVAPKRRRGNSYGLPTMLGSLDG